MSSEQKKRLLKAKVAVALQNELGRVPKEEEIEQVTLLARVMYKAVLGLHYKSLFGKVHTSLASRLSIRRIIATSMNVSLVCTFRPMREAGAPSTRRVVTVLSEVCSPHRG